ncbi:hypothetical protein K439DRAFT_1367777, partial [Ramaria rubella]
VRQLTSHKFLGVILDQELRMKENTNYALQKGTKWILHFGSEDLPRLPKGSQLRKFYLAVAILYAAVVFLVPESTHSIGTKGRITKLAWIQRMAAVHAIGAMRTSPTDSVDAHAQSCPQSSHPPRLSPSFPPIIQACSQLCCQIR